MPSSIAYTQNYTTIIDEVYQRASVSRVLNSGRRMVRAGRNAKEIMIPKITVSGLGDYVRNEGYKTGSINYEFETKTFNYDRGIRLMADVMDVEEAGVLDCFSVTNQMCYNCALSVPNALRRCRRCVYAASKEIAGINMQLNYCWRGSRRRQQ